MNIYCPLLAASERSMDDRCTKEECAWWDKTNECCAVLSIASGMYSLWKQTTECQPRDDWEEIFKEG